MICGEGNFGPVYRMAKNIGLEISEAPRTITIQLFLVILNEFFIKMKI